MTSTRDHPAIEFTETGAIYRPGNGHVIRYRKVNGIYYHADSSEVVVRALEHARSCRLRVRLYFGDVTSGRDWLEENDVEGYIGNSMGSLRVPLLTFSRRSTGGPAILDRCIIKIKLTTGGVIYQHPQFHTGTFVIREIGSEEFRHGESLRSLGYTHSVDVDDRIHAHFRSLEAARRYLYKMTE